MTSPAIKALSLYNPHATLMALGEKTWETRGFDTKHRGPLAIHASKTSPDEYLRLRYEEPFRRSLSHPEAYRHHAERRFQAPPYSYGADDALPSGCVLAVTEILETVRVEKFRGSDKERAFGDFTAGEGRFAWRQDAPALLPWPAPARGMPGLWPWTPEDADLSRWLLLWQAWKSSDDPDDEYAFHSWDAELRARGPRP